VAKGAFVSHSKSFTKIWLRWRIRRHDIESFIEFRENLHSILLLFVNIDNHLDKNRLRFSEITH